MNNLELKKIRKKLSFNQKEMAEELLISLRKYQYIESGENEIDAETAKILEEIVLKISEVDGVNFEFTSGYTPFFDKNQKKITHKDISEYVVRNVDKFKEDIAFKNMIDKEALIILLKAKKGDTIDIDLIGK